MACPPFGIVLFWLSETMAAAETLVLVSPATIYRPCVSIIMLIFKSHPSRPCPASSMSSRGA